jgi:hypothetical protein
MGQVREHGAVPDEPALCLATGARRPTLPPCPPPPLSLPPPPPPFSIPPSRHAMHDGKLCSKRKKISVAPSAPPRLRRQTQRSFGRCVCVCVAVCWVCWAAGALLRAGPLASPPRRGEVGECTRHVAASPERVGVILLLRKSTLVLFKQVRTRPGEMHFGASIESLWLECTSHGAPIVGSAGHARRCCDPPGPHGLAAHGATQQQPAGGGGGGGASERCGCGGGEPNYRHIGESQWVRMMINPIVSLPHSYLSGELCGGVGAVVCALTRWQN